MNSLLVVARVKSTLYAPILYWSGARHWADLTTEPATWHFNTGSISPKLYRLPFSALHTCLSWDSFSFSRTCLEKLRDGFVWRSYTILWSYICIQLHLAVTPCNSKLPYDPRCYHAPGIVQMAGSTSLWCHFILLSNLTRRELDHSLLRGCIRNIFPACKSVIAIVFPYYGNTPHKWYSITFFHIAVVIVIITQNTLVIIWNPCIVTTAQYTKLRNRRLARDLSHEKGG
jgi:hypothetical protein